MPRHLMRWRWLVPLFVALALVSSAAQAALFGLNLRMRADPDRVPADSNSEVVVSVEVLDALGQPVADGTEVHFVTTLGEIVSPVETVGGLAETVLTASNAAGTALVSALVGATRETLEVEFEAEPGSATPGSRVVELSADDLSYSADQRLFVAASRAVVRYQAVEITADALQYEMAGSVVCAQGNVTLRSSERAVQADALRYELLSTRGRLVRVSGEVERLLVEGDRLETRPDDSQHDSLWEPINTDITRTWVKADRAIVYPGQKVILDHASFYVDGTRVLGLRRHVINPRFGGAPFGQALGFSSVGGVSFDFPWYYRASASRIGSLHVTRNSTVGMTQYEPGWSLGLREEYIREGRHEGSFSLDDVADPGRGLRWEHRMLLGHGSSLGLGGSTFNLGDESPSFRAASASYTRQMSGGRLSMVLSGSDFGESEHFYSSVRHRFASHRTGSGILVTPSLSLRHSRTRVGEEEIAIDPDTGEPLQIVPQSTGTVTSPGVDLDVSLPGHEIRRNLQLTAGLRTGYDWGLSQESQGSLSTRVGLTYRRRNESYANLSYSYTSRPAGIEPSLFTFGRQMLSLRGQTRVSGCHIRLNSSMDLDGSRRFGAVHLSRALPFGTDATGQPLWGLNVSHFFSRLDTYQVRHTQMALTRSVGRYRASICYSPQGIGDLGSRPWLSTVGYGYTYSGGRHVWVELTSLGY